MATTTEEPDTGSTDTTDDGQEFFRLRAEIDISFKGDAMEPPEARALLTPMAVEPQEDGVYRVTDRTKSQTVDLSEETCTCSAGSRLDSYRCQHLWHVFHRKRTGTISSVPDRMDPVERRAEWAKEQAEASRERARIASTPPEGRVEVTVAEDEQRVVCTSCGGDAAVPEDAGVDASVFVCGACLPSHDSVMFFTSPNESDGRLVFVRDVVSGESASQHYPEGESILSLGDIYSVVEGVSGGDSVVLVSEPVCSSPVAFGESRRAVPQGALRAVSPDE